MAPGEKGGEGLARRRFGFAVGYVVDFLPKLKLEIAAPEEQVEAIVEAIIALASTGKIGDGKIFVAPLEQVVRIRTGETGVEAI